MLRSSHRAEICLLKFFLYKLFKLKISWMPETIPDNLHEMSNPVFWEIRKNILNLSSAKFVHRVVKAMVNVLKF